MGNTSKHSTFKVFIHARSKDPSHEELIRYLVQRWNSTEKPSCPGGVELWLGSHAEAWYGFTNGIYPDDPAKRTSDVRYVTSEEVDAALSAFGREMEEHEREKRRTNPVRNPIKLPTSIAAELARYLKLEFPDLEDAPCRLSAPKLKFVGEVTINGVPTQFWSVADAEGQPIWGVVERFDDCYVLSFAEELPAELHNNKS